MSVLKLGPSGPLRGKTRPPGDKSISHRAVMLASVARGKTLIRGALKGEDVISTASAFKAMGVAIEDDGDSFIAHGKGHRALKSPEGPIYLGNSGTSMRLLAGLLAGLDVKVELTGDESLVKRPMARITDPLALMGARVSAAPGGTAPLKIEGGPLKPIRYEMPVASAQVKSSVLLAGLFAEGETWVREPAPTRDHTELMLPFFGAEVKREKGGWSGVKGVKGLESPGEIRVPGDISSAAFFIVAALIVPGSELLIENVGVNPTRSGILDALGEMGADISRTNERLEGGEPVCDLIVRASDLRAVTVEGDAVPRSIDELPVLCVAAARASGKTVIKDAAELRVKESDRISAMSGLLKSMGVDVDERPDGLEIKGKSNLRGARVSCGLDHRVGMSAAVAALIAEGETIIEGAECISTSFPNFASSLTGVAR